ncbi:MAG: thiamine phosphate synthase [Burkholderiaceae bacterium]
MSTLRWHPDVLSLTLASLHSHMMPIRVGLESFAQSPSEPAPVPATQEAWLAELSAKQTEHDQALFAQVNEDFALHHQDPSSLSMTQLLTALLTVGRTLEFTQEESLVLAQAWMHQSLREGRFDPLKWPTRIKDFVPKERGSEFHFEPCEKLKLYAVLPDAQWVDRMAQAGVPTVQLRLKSADRGALSREVKEAVQAVKGTATQLFINDHWQEAIEHGAFGVHLGQEDLQSASLKEIEQAQCRLGVSTHGYTEMLKAHALRPSYMALGAVFPTTLKQMQTLPQGLGRLSAYAQLMSPYSLVAIGGIDESQFQAVLSCGVGSIAVVRALVAADKPEEQVKKLLSYFERSEDDLMGQPGL